MTILKLCPQIPLPEITNRQRTCLSFIIWYIHKNNICPTHKEINKAMGVSPSVQSASGIVDPLKKKGYLVTSGAGRRNLIPNEISYRVLNDSDIEFWNRYE
jgi:SOS-response transcriptional repressor LexA